MANTTIRGAKAIHGANPITLIETVIRLRIWESSYWKEECFALTAVSLIDKAIKLNTIGGVYDNTKPTEFICLLLKLLQIQPEKEIIVEYLLVEEYKYLRALAAIYIRLTFGAVEVYELLEPLLNDYSKLRQLSISGYSLTYMDEFVDKLLNEDRRDLQRVKANLWMRWRTRRVYPVDVEGDPVLVPSLVLWLRVEVEAVAGLHLSSLQMTKKIDTFLAVPPDPAPVQGLAPQTRWTQPCNRYSSISIRLDN
ncbi:14658_t:CDS:2 [Acaulospora colombiana]|uniref:14658_t:CDS:1 n=1 Tax=Acaulospora colombiana TaxID=27376 RepID=A0ACA9M6P6_9GLOM|nr:14658_t:CDS:2 [Acaulospora colombiana]